jgi:hypothetical protein
MASQGDSPHPRIPAHGPHRRPRIKFYSGLQTKAIPALRATKIRPPLTGGRSREESLDYEVSLRDHIVSRTGHAKERNDVITNCDHGIIAHVGNRNVGGKLSWIIKLVG